ncbi:hypothetical protein VHEMI08460 [[Torrubiella] hemipterigena]|uniref:DUF7907 domain-containing protein n=1 Tax=[Torrubiella] hemipterigena TaxID=1531966 RepID=A0A0A1T6T4_9HYPO|nr:hypothetical protein VHEMI08460 [[Torrubiella] hemipterigena]
MPATSILSLAMAGLASAAAIARSATTTETKAFNLMVRVDGADFTPAVNGNWVTGVHIGAALDAVVPTADFNLARTFYVNGTDEEIDGKQGRLISDASDQFFQGWEMAKDGNTLVSNVILAPGNRNPGVTITEDGLAYLQPEDYMACNVPSPHGGTMVAISQRDTTNNANLPPQCIKIRLIPQCAELHELGPDATYNHNYARTSRCYEDATVV